MSLKFVQTTVRQILLRDKIDPSIIKISSSLEGEKVGVGGSGNYASKKTRDTMVDDKDCDNF